MQSAFSTLTDVQRDEAYRRAARRLHEVKEEKKRLLADTLEALQNQRSLQELQTVPPVFEVFKGPARNKGAWGGRGSAKSWTFAKLLLQRMLAKHGTRAVCVREVQKSLEQSVKQLLESLISRYRLTSHFRILNTHIETPGNGLIIFQGMQNHTADSIKSLEGYDIAWVEEAQSLSDRSLTILRPTIRRPGSELWFTWNPRKVSDPIDTFLRGETLPPNTVVRRVNYYDNPYFKTSELQAEMEWDRSRDMDKYLHVWEGAYEKNTEARVFKNYTIEEFTTPSDTMFLLGGDWGFSTDPTVLARLFIQGRRLFIDREVYKVGCEIDDTPALFDSLDPNMPGMARNWIITADSARPETISYLQRHGYPLITPARKGAGSVEEGVQFLKNYDIVIHPRCKHTADEFASYAFKKHPLTGEVTPVLEDKKNHVIDSIRYAIEPLRKETVPTVEAW